MRATFLVLNMTTSFRSMTNHMNDTGCLSLRGKSLLRPVKEWLNQLPLLSQRLWKLIFLRARYDSLQENLLQLYYQLTCSDFGLTGAVTWIWLKEHFNPTSMHSHCALCVGEWAWEKWWFITHRGMITINTIYKVWQSRSWVLRTCHIHVPTICEANWNLISHHRMGTQSFYVNY